MDSVGRSARTPKPRLNAELRYMNPMDAKIADPQLAQQNTGDTGNVQGAIASELPVTIIQPTRGWRALHWAELWHHRELLLFLTWRDIIVRYKQAALGVAWAVLNPLLTMLVYTIIFSHLAKFETENGIPYPVFFYSAMLPWSFFAGAVGRAGSSLINNAQLLSKVYFPRLHIPMAAILAGILDFAISCAVLLVLMCIYHVWPTWRVLLVPCLLLVMILGALALGLWVASISVRYRDAQNLVPMLLQILMFASPVIYSQSKIFSPTIRLLYNFNPLVAPLQAFRWAFAGGMPPTPLSIVACAVITLGVLAGGLYYFSRVESTFADMV